MNKIENNKISEVCYEEMLENGLQVMIIPKKNIQKKFLSFNLQICHMILI